LLERTRSKKRVDQGENSSNKITGSNEDMSVDTDTDGRSNEGITFSQELNEPSPSKN